MICLISKLKQAGSKKCFLAKYRTQVFLVGVLLATPLNVWGEETSTLKKKLLATDSAKPPVKRESLSFNCPPLKKGTSILSNFKPIANVDPEYFKKRQCTDPDNQHAGKGILVGDFHIENNVWNGHRSFWDWRQCIEIEAQADGTYRPSWNYDWGDEDSLKTGFPDWTEKSFPRVVFGVSMELNHRKKPFPDTEYFEKKCNRTGLPALLKEVPRFEIDFSFSSTKTTRRKGHIHKDGKEVEITGDERNATFLSLIYPSCTETIKPVNERILILLVWTEKGPERTPTGHPPDASFTDSLGREFDVYIKKKFADNTYLAMVPKEDIQSGTYIFNDFLNFLKTKEYAELGINEYSDDWCLSNIMFGTELWWGEGSFSINKLDILRKY